MGGAPGHTLSGERGQGGAERDRHFSVVDRNCQNRIRSGSLGAALVLTKDEGVIMDASPISISIPADPETAWR